MVGDEPRPKPDAGRQRIRDAFVADEGETVRTAAAAAALGAADRAQITAAATRLVTEVRARPAPGLGIETLLQEYQLNTAEGIALTCLAEAPLRIPHAHTPHPPIPATLRPAASAHPPAPPPPT